MPNLKPDKPLNPSALSGESRKSAPWTPGPWDKIVKMDGFTAVGAKTLVARVFSQAFRDVANETANARLIAAAPDLYEALEELVKAGEHDGPCDNEDVDGWPCELHLAAADRRRKVAMIALAKARGETL